MAGRHVEKRVAVWCWYRWHETHPDEECSSSSQCEGRAGKALGRNASNVGMTGVLRNVRAFPLRSGSRVDSVPASTVTELTALDPDAAERLLALSLGYTHTAGHPVLRGRIASLYATVRPEEVIV